MSWWILFFLFFIYDEITRTGVFAEIIPKNLSSEWVRERLNKWDGQAIFDAVKNHELDLEFEVSPGETLLMAAVAKSQVDLTNALLAAGAAPWKENKNGQNSYEISLSQKRLIVTHEILEAQLLWALETSDLPRAMKAVTKGAYINIRDEDGYSILLLAAAMNNERYLRKILRHKPNLSITEKSGWSIAHFLAAYNNYDVLEDIVQQKIPIPFDLVSNDGDTPLDIAQIRKNKGAYVIIRDALRIRDSPQRSKPKSSQNGRVEVRSKSKNHDEL